MCLHGRVLCEGDEMTSREVYCQGLGERDQKNCTREREGETERRGRSRRVTLSSACCDRGSKGSRGTCQRIRELKTDRECVKEQWGKDMSRIR